MDEPANVADDVELHAEVAPISDRSGHPDRAERAVPHNEPAAALIEVLPGVVLAFGHVPEALNLELLDVGLVPAADRTQLATTLGSVIGNTATIGGNVATAVSAAQGVYRVSSATQALLNSGALLAVKDGANLGSVWMNGQLVAQARFIPVTAINLASAATAIGPAIAMVALQVQLNEISGLVRANIALTTETLGTLRRQQWAELDGHMTAVDRALARAREIESVPASLWDTIAGNQADLDSQLDLYRRHVGDHLKRIKQVDTRARREYLDANAEAIVCDSHALLSALKAWTGYNLLHASRARAVGRDDPDEARLVEIILRDTPREFETMLADATQLVDAVTRELRLVVETAGPMTAPLSPKRKNLKAARFTSSELLKAIEPLADALRPAPPPLSSPATVCGPRDVDLNPYLRVLRWVIDEGESLRGIAFCYDLQEADVISLGQNVVSRIDSEQWASFAAVTNRRLVTSRASGFRRYGRIDREFPLGDVRYVRVRPSNGSSGRTELDITTREVDLRWVFRGDVENEQVDELAAILAEEMTLPAAEREALLARAETGRAEKIGTELEGTATVALPPGSAT